MADERSKERLAEADKREAPRVLDVETARLRRHLRLVPRPLAYCRPENDNGRRGA